MATATRTRATEYTGPYAALVNLAARSNGLDPWWLAAVLFVENRFKPTGPSPAGAEGIAQIELPEHPDVTKAQADNPAFAIPWAARTLADYRRRAGGSLTRGTMFYNTGPNANPATLRTAGVAYLDQVQAAYRDLRKSYGGGAPAAASGVLAAGLAWPLAQLGKIIGKPYSGTHADFGNWESDNAVDIATPVGTPVFAVDAGTIGPQIGSLHEGGQLAGLRLHLRTAGDEFYYAHLSRLAVKAGQHVQKGQLLGYSGSANGVAHLHIAERASFDPGFASDPAKAQNVSFWSNLNPFHKPNLHLDPGILPGTRRGDFLGPGGAVAGAAGSLGDVGKLAGDFRRDPAYPFLWLLAMLLGVALVYVGLTRLFGVRPVRDYISKGGPPE